MAFHYIFERKMDNQPEEFQDSTSNLTNTETELNYTQQGYIQSYHQTG